MSRYNLHSIAQVGADVWFEMYNGVHGGGSNPTEMQFPPYRITGAEWPEDADASRSARRAYPKSFQKKLIEDMKHHQDQDDRDAVEAERHEVPPWEDMEFEAVHEKRAEERLADTTEVKKQEHWSIELFLKIKGEST